MKVKNCVIRVVGTVIVLLAPALSEAKVSDNLKIEISAPQWKGETLKFVSYFNGNRYTQMVARLSDEGNGVFRSDRLYPEGLYLIYLDSVRCFDILLSDDQTFKIRVDTTDFVRNNRIEGAEQSEAFAEYSRFLADKHRERAQLLDEFNARKSGKGDAREIAGRIDSLNKRVVDFQETFFRKRDGQWVACFFKGLAPVESDRRTAPRTREEAMEEYRFLKYHYFDNIDLQDGRFWYTNYFPKKIDYYVSNIVEPIPDSIASAASRLVSFTLGDTLCAQMMLGRLVNYALTSEQMGMENVWARLAEDYYFKGLAYNPDSVFTARLQAEYRNIRYNRVGMQARDLALQDSAGTPTRLFDLPGKLTLLYFFEPGCGFCKKITPRIYNEIYKKYKDKGLTVACVCISDNRQEWQDYLNEGRFLDWRNLWDPERVSFFWEFYDTSTTPGVYVIDADHKIIAKKLDVENLDRFLSAALNN